MPLKVKGPVYPFIGYEKLSEKDKFKLISTNLLINHDYSKTKNQNQKRNARRK